MNRSKIEYCDHTFNIVTGCRHDCPYCYARTMSRRFSGNICQNIARTDEYRMEGDGLYVLDEPFVDDNGKQVIYPFGFAPTFHRYRMGTLDKLKMGNNIFVGAMADLFGEWVPDEWIIEVLNRCLDRPQHNYLFLTKNPRRYISRKLEQVITYKPNMWYGTTITKEADIDRLNDLPIGCKTFISIEPLLEDLKAQDYGNMFFDTAVDWIIIGAETGRNKDKVVPKWEWIQDIVLMADAAGIPVFMKDSLIPIVGEKNMRREFPPQLQVRKRSAKVHERLSGKCVKCGTEQDKKEMVSLYARVGRSGQMKTVATMCRECYRNWCDEMNIESYEEELYEKKL